MQQADFSKLFISVIGLSNLAHVAGDKALMAIDEDNYRDVLRLVDEAVVCLSLIGAKSSLKTAKRQQATISKEFVQSASLPGQAATGMRTISGKSLQRFINQNTELYGRIRDELAEMRAFILSDEAAGLFEADCHAYGPEVAIAFPNALIDIGEASKCLALGRNTASVFHLMRAMEEALRVLAASLGCEVESKVWGEILTKLDEAIKSKPRKSAADKKVFKELSEIYALLFHVKEKWRNPTMHPEASYTYQQAQDVYHSVNSFMRALAKRTDKQ